VSKEPGSKGPFGRHRWCRFWYGLRDWTRRKLRIAFAGTASRSESAYFRDQFDAYELALLEELNFQPPGQLLQRSILPMDLGHLPYNMEDPRTQQVNASRSALDRRLEPPLMLVESWLRSGSFDHPPPPGSQSITLLLNGRLRPGKRSTDRLALEAGDVRWSSSRSTEVHVAEGNEAGSVQMVRLWIRADEPGCESCPPPHCHDMAASDIPVRVERGARVKVLCGSSGPVQANSRAPSTLTFVELELEPGAEISQTLSATHRGLLYVLRGTGYVGLEGTPVSQNKSFVVPAASALDGQSELGIVAGRSGLHAFLAAGPVRGALAQG
jgi:redox-sensitive bicupin YhaK (pirin superfamily)